jgi:hypothetical protein
VVENFSANLTAHVQPTDAGIIHCFKAHYHACFMDHYNGDIPPADVYDINILEAMQLANIAWNEVDTTTIHNCWQKSGILPNTLLNPDSTPNTPAIHISSLLNNEPANPVTAAEKDVSASLDHLEEIGVLQQGNWMDLTELLNLVNKDNSYKEVTDEKIYQVVLERHKAEQQREINEGGDSDNNSKSMEKKPSCHKALSAALTIQKYVANLDEPFAHKLEGLLASFGCTCQTRLDKLIA